MTNIPPSDPRSSQRRNFDYDELIGILVAFAAIGGILFWVLWRKLPDWDWTRVPSLITNPVATAPVQDNSGLNNLIPTPTVSVPITAVPPTLIPTPTPTIATEKTSPDGAESTGEENADIVSSGVPRIVPILPIAPPPITTGEDFQVTTPVTKMPTIPPARKFIDVQDNFWASDFIDVLSSRSVIKGFDDSSFRPNQAVNRAEFAAILEQAFDKPTGGKSLKFADIPSDFWATGAINESVGMNFLSGYPDNSFKPGQPIPRVQVIVALVSGLGNLKTPANPAQVVSIYKDAKDIPKYALRKSRDRNSQWTSR